jgi:hypothetical protein
MPLGKRLIGQLYLIITILNIKRLDKYGVYMQYIRAIIELLQLLNYGVLYLTHNIVKVKKWPYSNS